MIFLLIILIVLLIILQFIPKNCFELFSTTSNKTLLIFVSKSCGHCVNYNQKYHDSVIELANKKGVNLKRIYSDDDPENLFEKMNIMYVPTCIIMEGGKIQKNLGSNVNPQSIEKALE